jgi:hypothetical protein
MLNLVVHRATTAFYMVNIVVERNRVIPIQWELEVTGKKTDDCPH